MGPSHAINSAASPTAAAYNELRYNNLPIANTHPARLHVLARLAGLQPSPIETCRVLELGASEGTNLLGMAVGMPTATFVGVDLADRPIRRGNALIADLGIGNVTLHATNLLDIGPSFGQFDYILTHGIYGWTPPEVGNQILEIARQCLAPHGVAFVSYNTLPAGHIRRMVRDMLLFHTQGIEDPAERLKSARAFLTVLAMGRPEPDSFDAAAASYAATLLKHSDSALFRDDLAPVYQPVHFHEFVAHAAAHGLQYCGEATGYDAPRNLKSEALEGLKTFSAGDPIRNQQYLDFLRMRGFRQSLLCHTERNLQSEWLPSNIEGFFAHTSAVEVEENTFACANNTFMKTSHPAPLAYMHKLIAARPRSLSVTREDAGLVLELFKVGILELRAQSTLAHPGGETPCSSPLVRTQIRLGETMLTTLWHRPVEISDDKSRQALLLMDGTHDLATLCELLECEREILDRQIAALAQLGFLIG